MLREIYLRRYGKALAAFAVVVIGFSLFMANNVVNNWHTQRNYYTSEEFQKNYSTYPLTENDHITPEMEIEIMSYVFVPIDSMGTWRDDLDFEETRKAYLSYDPKVDYYSHQLGDAVATLTLILVSLAGFLLFFVDQKTAFNRFLFSLPTSRKQLFRSKFFLLGGVILGSALIGQLLYVAITYWGIPQPYMNVPLAVYLSSFLQIFCQQAALFTASALIGSMVGNLVFGPLTWVFFMFFTFTLRLATSGIASTIEYAFPGTFSNTPLVGDSLFVASFGKNAGYWFAPILFILVAALSFLWGQKKYATLSLEYDGDYQLHHESRPAVWLVMTGYTSLILMGYWLRPFDEYLMYRNGMIDYYQPTLSAAVASFVVELLMIAGICFIIVYFSAIKNRWRSWRDAKLKDSLV